MCPGKNKENSLVILVVIPYHPALHLPLLPSPLASLRTPLLLLLLLPILPPLPLYLDFELCFLLTPFLLDLCLLLLPCLLLDSCTSPLLLDSCTSTFFLNLGRSPIVSDFWQCTRLLLFGPPLFLFFFSLFLLRSGLCPRESTTVI